MEGVLWTLVSHVPLHYALSNWLNTWLKKLSSAAWREVIKPFFPLFLKPFFTMINATFISAQGPIKTSTWCHVIMAQSTNILKTYSLTDCSIFSNKLTLILKYCTYLYRLHYTNLLDHKRCQTVNIQPPDLRLKSISNPVSHMGAWAVLQLRWQTATHCAGAYYKLTKRRRRILKANILSIRDTLRKQNLTWSLGVGRSFIWGEYL